MTITADKTRLLSVALTFGAVFWALAIVAAPYLAEPARMATSLLYAAGALICHQQPGRSFHLAGAQLPVCARCTGLYLGAAVGVLLWALRGRRWMPRMSRPSAVGWLAVLGAPTAVTVATAMGGVFDPPNIWRAALALPLGAAAGFIVGAAASNHLK